MSEKRPPVSEIYGTAPDYVILCPGGCGRHEPECVCDRHPKWQRVEPGTVIPAGQPYRVEYADKNLVAAREHRGDVQPFFADPRTVRPGGDPNAVYFIDSSWKPPHPCNAPLNIKGQGFNCDKGWGHALPHGNTEAGAIWDGEQSPTDSPEPTR